MNSYKYKRTVISTSESCVAGATLATTLSKRLVERAKEGGPSCVLHLATDDETQQLLN